jgi:hypothetical protein
MLLKKNNELSLLIQCHSVALQHHGYLLSFQRWTISEVPWQEQHARPILPLRFNLEYQCLHLATSLFGDPFGAQ